MCRRRWCGGGGASRLRRSSSQSAACMCPSVGDSPVPHLHHRYKFSVETQAQSHVVAAFQTWPRWRCAAGCRKVVWGCRPRPRGLFRLWRRSLARSPSRYHSNCGSYSLACVAHATRQCYLRLALKQARRLSGPRGRVVAEGVWDINASLRRTQPPASTTTTTTQRSTTTAPQCRPSPSVLTSPTSPGASAP